MATWQADFFIRIPAPWPADLQQSLDALLPRERAQFANWITWGSHTGLCLDVPSADTASARARLRLDMRAWNGELVRQLVGLFGSWHCELRHDGQFVPLSYEEVERTAQGSLAARFVASAPGFFDLLARGAI